MNEDQRYEPNNQSTNQGYSDEQPTTVGNEQTSNSPQKSGKNTIVAIVIAIIIIVLIIYAARAVLGHKKPSTPDQTATSSLDTQATTSQDTSLDAIESDLENTDLDDLGTDASNALDADLNTNE
jgi:hypothetical protein